MVEKVLICQQSPNTRVDVLTQGHMSFFQLTREAPAQIHTQLPDLASNSTRQKKEWLIGGLGACRRARKEGHVPKPNLEGTQEPLKEPLWPKLGHTEQQSNKSRRVGL